MAAIRELTQWIITYDKNGMPGSIEGLQTCDLQQSKLSKRVRLDQIFSLDLERLTLIDNAGKEWKLTGPGFQSILVDHVEPFSFVEVHPDGPEEEDDEEEYEA